eukprot:8108059-Pyramimonas_sp.AAC.1
MDDFLQYRGGGDKGHENATIVDFVTTIVAMETALNKACRVWCRPMSTISVEANKWKTRPDFVV